MSETAANPETGPATPDQVVDLLVREQEAADRTEAQAPAHEPTTSEAADPEPQTEEPQPEPKYTVKVRGQEVEVSLDELRNGYSRNEDYRHKTAEVAEQRRAVEAKQAEIAARAQQLDALLERAEFDPVLVAGKQTDWATLARENPAEYVARKEAYEGRINYWRNAVQHRDAVRAQAAQAALADGERRMREVVPEWSDDGKRRELQTKLASTLQEYGFKPEEFASVADHRVLLVARDAMLYRQMQAERKSAEAKKAPPVAPKVMSPGVPQANKSNTQAKALLKAAAKSGRLDDQVNAVMAALDS